MEVGCARGEKDHVRGYAIRERLAGRMHSFGAAVDQVAAATDQVAEVGARSGF
jgi:hypothetical protein